MKEQCLKYIYMERQKEINIEEWKKEKIIGGKEQGGKKKTIELKEKKE